MLKSSTALAVAFLLAACGSDSTKTTTTPISCTSYCASMATTCTGGDVQFTGLNGTCESYCGTSNSWPDGVTGATSGNTGACRVTHVALAAAATDAATKTLHCGHAGPSGGNTCGTWCENYCFLALKNCGAHLGTGTDQMGFTDNATCLAACGGGATPFPTTGTINGNTIQFLVDTGATSITLSSSDAMRLGINYLQGERGQLQTANGMTAAYRVKLDSVRIGDVELNNVDGVVSENDAMSVTLLGMSFLNRMEMKRDGQSMTLTKRF